MMVKNNTYIIGIVFLLFFALISCEEKDVIITNDYVINPNWDKVDNSFGIIRMNLVDSVGNFHLNSISSRELLDNLVEDTSFVYRANVKYNGTDYAERKVYFNRYNGFNWIGNLHKSSSDKRILGQLQKNTWYLFTGLSNVRTLYYVYIDSKDSVYTYKVYASSWTNY